MRHIQRAAPGEAAKHHDVWLYGSPYFDTIYYMTVCVWGGGGSEESQECVACVDCKRNALLDRDASDDLCSLSSRVRCSIGEHERTFLALWEIFGAQHKSFSTRYSLFCVRENQNTDVTMQTRWLINESKVHSKLVFKNNLGKHCKQTETSQLSIAVRFQYFARTT